MSTVEPRLELYWIPLGAGTGVGPRVVRTSGRTYELISSLAERRAPQPLFHSALVLQTGDARYVVEVTPTPPTGKSGDRGVVAAGPVGSVYLGRLRIFRYEVRRWRDGVIPDLAHALDSPVVVSTCPGQVRAAFDAVPHVPGAVWGRDELGVGDMWNSNSVVSWTLERVGLAEEAGCPPRSGRAPGWWAGIAAGRLASRRVEGWDHDTAHAPRATSRWS